MLCLGYGAFRMCLNDSLEGFARKSFPSRFIIIIIIILIIFIVIIQSGIAFRYALLKIPFYAF